MTAVAEVRWIHLCDYAFTDQSGKPCLVGIFSKIFAQRVPASHTKAALALEVVGDPDEIVNLRIRLLRPDSFGSPKGELFDVPVEVNLGPKGGYLLMMTLDNLPLPDFGQYAVEVKFDDTVVRTLEFDVARLQAS